MSYWIDKYLMAAKALGAKDWSHPKVIQLARRMAHDGATFDEIFSSTGWTCAESTARKRLLQFNIRPRGMRGDPHRGDLPYLSPAMTNSNGDVDQRPYQPRGAQ